MSQGNTQVVNPPRSTKVRLTDDVWELAVEEVRYENERSPIYRVSLQGITNEAVRQYCLAKRAEREANDDRAA
jgi:hypothetical protein